MKRLNRGIANAIVEEATALINYNINIMDSSGEIIASGDKSRIGTIHEGAVLSINRCDMVIITEKDSNNLNGTYEGVNIPFYCRGKLKGVVGITGKHSEVINYAQLIKMTVELYVEKELLIEEQIKHRDLKEKFYLSLLKNKNDVFNANIINLFTNKLMLDDYHIVVIIKFFNMDFIKLSRELEKAINIIDKSYINFYIMEDGNKIILVVTNKLEEKLEIITENMMKKIIVAFDENLIENFKVYVGSLYRGKSGIHKSYVTAKNITNINLVGEEKVLYSKDCMLETIYSKVKNSYEVEELKKIWEKLVIFDSNGELRETINYFYKYNGENIIISKEMNIHRNTLSYRLSKIKKITGKNPKVMNDMFLLIVAQNIYINS